MAYRKLRVSEDGTHHTLDGLPAYSMRFVRVEKFHPPGLAPALGERGAHHIRDTGEPAYERRFLRVFGFYEERAAVVSDRGWHHIRKDGSDLYPERFSWLGNFQEGRCPVRERTGMYGYLDIEGNRVGDASYKYAGDFRDGMAVVRELDGLCIHIWKDGVPVHRKKYLDLDVYHKGYARARDERGWFHTDLHGNQAYSHRFLEVEPFYNGFAHVKDQSGRVGVIDEDGKWVHTVTTPTLEENWSNLSGMLTGHWKTHILASAVRLGIVDALEKEPMSAERLAGDLNLDPEGAARLIRALQVLGVVQDDDGDDVILTDVGILLSGRGRHSLREASLSWSEWNYRAWAEASCSIREGVPSFDVAFGKPFFDWIEDYPEKAEIYHKAMARYASYDYERISDVHDFSIHKCLMDAGGGRGILLSTILSRCRNLKGILFDLKSAIASAEDYLTKCGVADRCELVAGGIFECVPKGADAIILSRVIHDWDDVKAGQILHNCWQSLDPGGALYLLELIMSDDRGSDLGVLVSLNNYVMLGGRERTLHEYVDLVETSGFEFIRVAAVSPVSNLLIFRKRR